MDYNYDDDTMEIDLKELFFALWRKLWLILLIAVLLGGMVCAGTYYLMTPYYVSSSMLLVRAKEETISSLSDLQIGSQLTNDYSIMITSPPVLEEVISQLNLGAVLDVESLEEMITVENPSDTRILEITVQYTDPVLATEIVNELSEAASEFIGDSMEIVPPKIIKEGEIPTEKAGPSLRRNTILGFLAGFVLSCGVIVLLEILDDTIKNEDDIEKYLGIPTLASVPDRKDYITGKKKRAPKKAKGKARKKGDIQ